MMAHAPTVAVRVVGTDADRVVNRFISLRHIVDEHHAIIFTLYKAQHMLSNGQPPPKLWVASTTLLLFEWTIQRDTTVSFKVQNLYNSLIGNTRTYTYVDFVTHLKERTPRLGYLCQLQEASFPRFAVRKREGVQDPLINLESIRNFY